MKVQRVTFLLWILQGRLRVDDVFAAILAYSLVRTQLYDQIMEDLKDGEINMAIDVSTLGPPTEFLLAIILVAALGAAFAAFFVSATRKADKDDELQLKNPEMVDPTMWKLKYIVGSVFAAILGGAIGIVVTPMIFQGLGIVGADVWFYSVATFISSMLMTRWCVIGIHKGPAEVLKDMQKWGKWGKGVIEKVQPPKT